MKWQATEHIARLPNKWMQFDLHFEWKNGWLFVGCVKCQDSHCWCAFIWLTANWEMMPVRCPYSMQLAKRTSSPFHCIKIYQRSRGASLSLSEYLMRKRALHGVRWHYNYKQLNTFLSNKKYVRKKWEFRIGRNIRKRIQVSSGHDQSIILPHQSTMCLCKNASPFARNEMMRTKKKNSEKHDEQNTHKIIRKDADFTTAAPYQVPGHRGQSRVPRQEEYNFSIITILKPLSFSLLRRVPSVSVLPASQQSSVAPVMVNARPMAKQWTWTNLQWV